jgi:hypothetical protein
MIIDPPSPFGSVQEWQTFLDDLKRIANPDDDVKRHIARAEMEISARQSRNG